MSGYKNMEITLDIDWREDSGFSPKLIVATNRLIIPEYEAYPTPYAEGGKGTLYVAQYGPLYVWLSHDPAREYGFGGQEFTVPMVDGTVNQITGPWASRAAVVSNVLSDHGRYVSLMDVTSDYGWDGIDANWAINNMPTGTALKRKVHPPLPLPGGKVSRQEITWEIIKMKENAR